MKASASRSADLKKTGVHASPLEMLHDDPVLTPVPDTADNVPPESAQSDSSPAGDNVLPVTAERRPPRRTRKAPSGPRIDLSKIAAHLSARPAPDLSDFHAEEHRAKTISDAAPAIPVFRLPWDTDDGKEYNSLFAASLRKPSKKRKSRPRTKESDVFPEFVPVFVRGMGECDSITRQKVCVWPGGTYLPLRQLSGLLGVSRMLLEGVMREISPGSLTDAANLIVYDEQERCIRPGDTTKKFGRRDRVLVNVFAFLAALPDILKAKRRAGVRKAARLKRVAEETDDVDASTKST